MTIALGLATVVHPSLGLQLALVLMGTWMAWAWFSARTGVGWPLALTGIAAAGMAVLPGLAMNLGPVDSLVNGLPAQDFWALAVELQSPQHMLPSLWRMPQWLAWAGYVVLAILALGDLGLTRPAEQEHELDPDRQGWPAARIRLVILLGVVLVWLLGAWVAIDVFRNLRITLFQPFRMATLARGLALILIAGRVARLWERGGRLGRFRAGLIVVALAGDWTFVVVTVAELVASISWDRMPILSSRDRRLRILDSRGRRVGAVAYAACLAYGVYFLSRHDTESGHWPILLVLAAGLVVLVLAKRHRAHRIRLKLEHSLALAWTVPSLALFAGLIPTDHWLGRAPLVHGLITRCRFTAVPIDDIERLALWCREHTPVTSRFIGPPGPKTFRLWSRRSLAFSRSASPYHAAGLADWFARFQDHVAIHESPAQFVREYVADRHRFEARYDHLSQDQLVALALRQGADYVVAPPPSHSASPHAYAISSLEHLHTEGRYAVYRVNVGVLAHRQR
jgi:hypothetical protein